MSASRAASAREMPPRGVGCHKDPSVRAGEGMQGCGRKLQLRGAAQRLSGRPRTDRHPPMRWELALHQAAELHVRQTMV